MTEPSPRSTPNIATCRGNSLGLGLGLGLGVGTRLASPEVHLSFGHHPAPLCIVMAHCHDHNEMRGHDHNEMRGNDHNECPRALLCLVYCAGRAQSCFLTILRIPSALLTRLAPAPSTLNSIPYSDTYVHTAMHRFIPMTPAQSGHARIYVYMPIHMPMLLRAA